MLKPETRTQISILNWLKLKHPNVYPYVIKIDNEGKRTKLGHVIAVKMGLQQGASDLFIAWPTSDYHGLFLEIKPDNWKKTKSNSAHYDRQLYFCEKMRKVGYFATVSIGVDACIKVVDKYLRGLL
jgi:hypothetical protein